MMLYELMKDMGVFQFFVVVFMMGVGWHKLSKLEESVRRIEGKLSDGISEEIVRLREEVGVINKRGCEVRNRCSRDEVSD